MRVRIDRNRCVCSESCARLAPNTFETDDEGLVTLLAGPFDGETAVRAAAANCPVAAIILEPVDR
ncbi:MAG: hypothetical protein ABS78_00970 [Phenylobacterium sp. SCN 70-31]|nr:MAG: hypothetical protein ABS78_00970 [Phenylobacterium sp. SCN 70-31]